MHQQHTALIFKINCWIAAVFPSRSPFAIQNKVLNKSSRISYGKLANTVAVARPRRVEEWERSEAGKHILNVFMLCVAARLLNFLPKTKTWPRFALRSGYQPLLLWRGRKGRQDRRDFFSDTLIIWSRNVVKLIISPVLVTRIWKDWQTLGMFYVRPMVSLKWRVEAFNSKDNTLKSSIKKQN